MFQIYSERTVLLKVLKF